MNFWQLQAERNAAIDRGVSVSVPGFDGWAFFVRPAHAWNHHYARAAVRIAASDIAVIQYLDAAAKPDFVPTAETQALDAAISLRGFVEGNLAGWVGVTGEDGAPLEFTAANASRLMTHFPQIYDFLVRFSREPANYPALSLALKLDIAAGNYKAGCGLSSDHGANTGACSQPATNGGKVRRGKSRKGAR